MDRKTLLQAGLSLPLIKHLHSSETNQSEIQSKVKVSKKLMIICLDFGFMRQDLFYGKSGDCDSPYFDLLKDIKGKYTHFYKTNQPNLLNSSHSAHPGALTCVKPSQNKIYSFESLDQYVGYQSLRENRHRTIRFVTGGTGRINWNSSGQKVPADGNVSIFANRLFGKVDTETEILSTKKQLDILTKVYDNAYNGPSSKVNDTLVSSLKVKIDELKEDLLWIQKGQADIGFEMDPSLGNGDQHIRLGNALDLCTLAFKHGLTKVASVYFDGSGHVDLKGVKSGFHGLSHKPRNDEALVQKKIVDEFVLKTVIKHVQDLEKQNMLDDTIVVLTGAMGNAASHSNHNLPVFLMGGGLKHKGLIDCQGEKVHAKITLADVYQTALAELGLPSMSLPFSNGPVKELLV